MITPIFSLSQTPDELTLKLHIPLADLTNSEFLIEDGTVYFGAPPYYLRLELPGSVREDDDYIHFKLKSGDIFITMTKSTPGEHFENLDLISKLIINPQPSRTLSKPGIELLRSTTSFPEGETDYNWLAELPTGTSADDETNENLSVFKFPYGFAASKSGLFADKPETCLPIDLPNPDFCPPCMRNRQRIQSVLDHFQPEHYIADYYEPAASVNALKQPIPWVEDKSVRPEFSDDHRFRLTVLSTHELPPLPPLPFEIDPAEEVKVEDTRTFVYLGLVDLLLAYTYDYRVREGDENCESGWVIAKIASTLSWLEFFPNLQTVLQSFYDRALSFPLIRNWKLCRAVQRDVAVLLQHQNAKAWILYVLLEIRRLLIDYPGYYIFVDLFLDDYIVWLQLSASNYALKTLGEAIASFKMKKTDSNLPLRKLEKISAEALAEEALTTNFENVSLGA